MSNTDDDSGAMGTEPIDPELPQPATRGQVHVSDRNVNPDTERQLRAHLAEHEAHLEVTRRYHRGVADQADTAATDAPDGLNRTVDGN
ncbi:MAG: hypothetical protein WAN76_19790 [Candidatus Sulfotelmatobacter sp.]